MAKSEKPLILVADDEPSTLALVASHLRGRGYRVIEASDGDDAWGQACRELPDLVVLDVMMPGMSGWEVCRKIREAVSLAHTGIVMLTGIGETLNELTSPLYGADAYLDKPFQFNQLAEVVKETLAARQGGALGRPTETTVAGAAQRGGTNGRPAARPWTTDGPGRAAGRTPPSRRRAKALLAQAGAQETPSAVATKRTTARKAAAPVAKATKKATARASKRPAVKTVKEPTVPKKATSKKAATNRPAAAKKKAPKKAPAKKVGKAVAQPAKKAPTKKAGRPGSKPAAKGAKKAQKPAAPKSRAKTSTPRPAAPSKKSTKKASTKKASPRAQAAPKRPAPKASAKKPAAKRSSSKPSAAKSPGKARRKNVA